MIDFDIKLQYFPGHMKKAQREMEEALKLVDLVIELRDARMPLASKNNYFSQIIGNKKTIIVLSKKDLANESETKKWIEHLSNENQKAIAINIVRENYKAKILNLISQLMADKIAKYRAKGLINKTIRCMIIGIPNVGKSSFINHTLGRNITKVANKAGITRHLQWVRLDKNVDLLDTPGVLLPKFETPQQAFFLALLGSINDTVFDYEVLMNKCLELFILYDLQALINYYQLAEKDYDLTSLIEAIYRKRAYPSYAQMATAFIKELRDGKIGRFTFELSDGKLLRETILE